MKSLLTISGIISLSVITIFNCGTAICQSTEEDPKPKTINWTGSIGTQMTSYSVSGIDRRMNPFHWGVYGNVNIHIMENFDVPLSFNYNKFGLDVQKPFYQLGISPKYKDIQLHLGHRNMFFNSYSLAGHTFFGVGMEYNPGKFRFAAMRGRLRDPLLIDQSNTLVFTHPQFRRTGWGVKIGIGDFSNFVDLMLFKASDDPMSVEGWEEPNYQMSISGLTGRFAPAENLILGLTSRKTLFKKAVWMVEMGASIYTDDITRDSTGMENLLFDPKTTSILKWAGKTSLTFPIGPLNMNLAYERILPNYFSMGMYNFIDDMENITISPSISLFQNKVFLNTMIGLQRNNLDNSRSETTRRVINTINATIAPKPEYGLNINYTNFSFNQQAGAIILSDSVLIRQVNKSITFMPYVNLIQDTSSNQSIHAAYIWNNAEDLNPVTREFGNLSTAMITANYSMTNSRGFQYGVGLSYTRLQSFVVDNLLRGVQVNGGKQLPKSGISIGANLQYNLTSADGQRDGTLISSGINGSILLEQKHNFRINLNWLKSGSQRFESYSEVVFNVGYNYQIR
jgi:hypothetical protein